MMLVLVLLLLLLLLCMFRRVINTRWRRLRRGDSGMGGDKQRPLGFGSPCHARFQRTYPCAFNPFWEGAVLMERKI